MTARRGSRLLRRLRLLLVVVVVLALAAVGGIAWYFSGLAVAVDRTVTYPHSVQAVLPGAVQLTRDELSTVPGTYGLAWDGGYGRVGPVRETTSGSVVRPFTAVDGEPAPGTPAWVDPDTYAGDPRSALGLDFREVLVRSDVGDLPTWFVPGDEDATTWVVFVHGRGGTREESLRYLTSWHEAGLSVVVPTYRNDAGAPASPDGRYHLGETEWRDAAAAVQWALANGARDVVLAGWSMGGAIVMQVVDRAAVGAAVRGVILDSPVLDWRDTFRSQGSDRGLPVWLTDVALRTLEVRSDIDLDRFDWPSRAQRLAVPVLLFHSRADTFVPDGPSRRLAAARPDLVTFVDVPGAAHTRAWNVDPEAYEAATAAWLAKVGALDPVAAG